MYETYLQNEREWEEKFPEKSDIKLNRKELRKAYILHNRLSLIKVMKALEKELEEKMGDYKCDNRNAKDNSEHLLTAGKCQAQEETLAKIREFISELEK